MQASYLTSLNSKDLYRYLAQNKFPSKRSTIHKVETLAERFILLDSLLFKLMTTPDKETTLLAIPEICVDRIITLYHTSLFAGHQGMIKTYLTTRQLQTRIHLNYRPLSRLSMDLKVMPRSQKGN